MYLNGMQLVGSKAMFDSIEVQKKTHKKKRINKKWLKRYGLKTIHVPKNEIFVFENKIIGHPKTLEKVIRKIESEGKA